MDYTLCNKCETGYPSYLIGCQNCDSYLFEDENDSVEDIADGFIQSLEEEAKKYAVPGWATKTLIFSVFTTAFKVWFLYTLTSGSYQGFLRSSVLSIIFLPIISAAIAYLRQRKWYRILLLDSLFMTAIFLVGGFLLIYIKMSK